jgi:hypothetical protein
MSQCQLKKVATRKVKGNLLDILKAKNGQQESRKGYNESPEGRIKGRKRQNNSRRSKQSQESEIDNLFYFDILKSKTES